MQIYLVGGAVRDQLMGLASADRDYVVVGGTPEAMLAAGYRSVGKDFPVFLHPDTNEEYALARTERKSGHGYHGFICHTDPHVRLEDDLRRRDLTINAIAQDAEGRIIDPFGGVRDLRDKVLRHVSDAFVEDPLRVLRVARFAARYHKLGFRVADETLALMRRIAESGELAHLVAERTWQETRKALCEPAPSAFLQVLRGCGALHALFPEIDRLYGVPARAEHHPEVDTGIHVEMVVDMAASLAPGDALVTFAALLHDLGKGATPPVEWPAHIAHESRGVPLVRAVCARLKVPREYAQAAEHACRFHLDCHRAFELRPTTALKLLTQIDALRKPDRLRVLLLVCEADKRGRLHHRGDAYPQANYLQEALLVVRRVSAEPWAAQGLSGAALGQALQEARVAALARLREIHQKS